MEILFDITHTQKSDYHLNPLKLHTYNPENLFLMKNKQLGNMASKVEMVHKQCISSLCDSFWRIVGGGGGNYYMEFKLLGSNLLVVDRGKLIHKIGDA